MNPYQRLMYRLGGTRAFVWFGRKVLTPIDTRRAGKKWTLATLGTDYPLCYVTTTGRKTGAVRTTPLGWVDAGNGAVAVVGTNWGTTHHPAWTYNLLADDRAELIIGTEKRPVRARLVGDEGEEERLWNGFIAAFPGYRTYRERTNRDIRLFVLEPVPPPQAAGEGASPSPP